MAEEIKIVASAVGFDQVDKALDNTTKSLEETSQAATQAGKALGNQLKAGSAQAQQSITNLSRVVSDAPYGFIGIANNINPLVESFDRLKAESGSVGGALKSLIGGLSGAGGLGLAFSAVTTAITFAQVGLTYWTKSTKAAKEQSDEYKKSLDSINSAVAQEGSQVSSMIAILQNETETRQRKLAAIKELQKINPEVFNQLRLEGNAVIGLTSAYSQYLANLKNVVAAKVIQNKLETEYTKLLELQGTTLTGEERRKNEAGIRIQTTLLQAQINTYKQLGEQGAAKVAELQKKLTEVTTGYSEKQVRQINIVKQSIQDLTNALSEISTAVKVDETTAKIKTIKEKFEKIKLKPLKLDLVVIKTKEVQDNIRKSLTEIIPPKYTQIPISFMPVKTGLINAADAINSFMNNAAYTIGTQFSDILAQAITGGISFGDAFKGMFNALGGVVVQLGEELIKLGTLALAARVAINSALANPFALIAVGIALAAFGKVVQSTTNKQRFATGTRYAPGGMALVGERGPEMINLPRGSQVLPAAQTSAMLGGIGQSIEVFGLLRGQDIYFSNKKYSQTYKRTT